MELTLEQALRKGIEAHKAGKAQEADRYYTAILKAQPKHPDANHNMGVLAVGVGKVEEGLPFFKTALEANPSTVQFWLSYIDALIKLDRIADAKAVFDQAKSKGAKGDSFNKLEERLDALTTAPSKSIIEKEQDQTYILDKLTLDKALKLARKKTKEGSIDKAKSIYGQILLKFPRNKKAKEGLKLLSDQKTPRSKKAQDPPQDQLKSLANLYNKGKFQEALDNASQLLEEFSTSPFLYNVIGAASFILGRSQNAMIAYRNAVSYKPDYAEAHNNIGKLLKDLGRLDEAMEAYSKALSIDPNYAEVYTNIGNILHDKNELNEAIKAYSKALSIKPSYAEVYYNMGNVFRKKNNLEEAMNAYRTALSIKPKYESVKYMLSSLEGTTPKTAPKEYIESLFDGYANKFETSLVRDLEYKMPSLLSHLLLGSRYSKQLGSVLDLGCGTGLLGVEIHKNSSYLEGIDLSAKMLHEAKQKNVYDTLKKVEIVDYLARSELNFDFFIATDVFIYVGDLLNLFRLIKERNNRSGKLVFLPSILMDLGMPSKIRDGLHILKNIYRVYLISLVTNYITFRRLT